MSLPGRRRAGRGLVQALFVLACAGLPHLAARAADAIGTTATSQTPDGREDCLTVLSRKGDMIFRLYTNAAPDASHLFNTFELEAYGQALLPSPGGQPLRLWRTAQAPDPRLYSILVNGSGPRPGPADSMRVIDRASGPDWQYVALDATGAYRSDLTAFHRAILWVEPDLLVLHDHLVARQPARFEMFLHPPAGTIVDPVWGDLRLELPGAGMRIHSPAPQKTPRTWREFPPGNAGPLLPGTIGVRLGPTNTLPGLDLLTAFVVHRAGEKQDLAFRLLLGNGAVGARIHRQGLPTLVAFRTDPGVPRPSLTGFQFSGPVGVDVFQPKKVR